MNPLAPVPSTAVRNVVPSAEVSTVYSRVLAEASSPQPAVGSIRNARDVDRRCGSSIVTRRRARRVAGGSGLSGLNEDQAVPCDWSNALSTPQPNGGAGVVADLRDVGAAGSGPPSRASCAMSRVRRRVRGDRDVADDARVVARRREERELRVAARGHVRDRVAAARVRLVGEVVVEVRPRRVAAEADADAGDRQAGDRSRSRRPSRCPSGRRGRAAAGSPRPARCRCRRPRRRSSPCRACGRPPTPASWSAAAVGLLGGQDRVAHVEHRRLGRREPHAVGHEHLGDVGARPPGAGPTASRPRARRRRGPPGRRRSCRSRRACSRRRRRCPAPPGQAASTRRDRAVERLAAQRVRVGVGVVADVDLAGRRRCRS